MSTIRIFSLHLNSLFSDVMYKMVPTATKIGFRSDIGLAVAMLPPITFKLVLIT